MQIAHFFPWKFHQNPYLKHRNNCQLLSNNWYLLNFIITDNHYQIAIYNPNSIHALLTAFSPRSAGIFSHDNRKWNRNSISRRSNNNNNHNCWSEKNYDSQQTKKKEMNQNGRQNLNQTTTISRTQWPTQSTFHILIISHINA